MTINQIRNRIFLFALAVIIQVIAPSAFAMKYQTFTLPKLVEKAEVIIDCTVTQTEPILRVSVNSAFKGEAKGEIEVVDQNIWLQDRPPLIVKQRVILFLDSKGKSYQFAALGRQVLWPKREVQWPFTDGCIASHDETASVISILIKISHAQKAERDDLIRQLLKSTISLGRLQGIEVWSSLAADEKHAFLDDVRTLDSGNSSDEVKKAATTAISKLATTSPRPKDVDASQKSK